MIHGPMQSYEKVSQYSLDKAENALYARIDENSLRSEDKTWIAIKYVMFIGTLNPKKHQNFVHKQI